MGSIFNDHYPRLNSSQLDQLNRALSGLGYVDVDDVSSILTRGQSLTLFRALEEYGVATLTLTTYHGDECDVVELSLRDLPGWVCPTCKRKVEEDLVTIPFLHEIKPFVLV